MKVDNLSPHFLLSRIDGAEVRPDVFESLLEQAAVGLFVVLERVYIVVQNTSGVGLFKTRGSLIVNDLRAYSNRALVIGIVERAGVLISFVALTLMVHDGHFLLSLLELLFQTCNLLLVGGG